MAYLEPPKYRSAEGGEPTPFPQVNTKKLWISILLPTGFVLVGLLVASSLPTETKKEGSWFGILTLLSWMAIVIGWILFGTSLAERFKGTGYVLLVLAYPLPQFLVTTTILFFGCVKLSDPSFH